MKAWWRGWRIDPALFLPDIQLELDQNCNVQRPRTGDRPILADRIPSRATLRKRLSALAGLAFGNLLTTYTGRGFNVDPPQITHVYPNL